MSELLSVFIYGLRDPRVPDNIRYVGKTDNLKYRFQNHLSPRNLRKKTHKNNWIKSLKASGVVPEIVLLDVVPAHNWEFFERAYIKVWREAGVKLTNSTDGGEGLSGRKHTAESKVKMSAAVRGRKRAPFTPEHRANLSKSHLGKRAALTEEHRAKISVAHKGKKMPPRSPEHCANLSAAKLGKNRGPNKKHHVRVS